MTEAICIPPKQLAPDTLRNLVEEFVSRDGTDYGAVEVDFSARTEQVMGQLLAGEVVIVYDPESDSCNLFPRDRLPPGVESGGRS